MRSLDDGLSWTEVLTLPPGTRAEAVATDPADAQVVYAGGEDCTGPECRGFVYGTTYGGDSWDLMLVTTDTVRLIVIDRWAPDVLHVDDSDYWVRKSIDRGDTWTVVRLPWWMQADPSGDLLALDPNVAHHVYMGGWGYFAETTDSGQTWSEWDDPMNQSTPEMEPNALTVDRRTVTQTLYAGFDGVWAYKRPAPQPPRVYLPLVFGNH